MYIGLTRLLVIGFFNAKYDSKRRLSKGYTSANWDNVSKIKKAVAADNNKDDDEENPQKNR